MKKLILIAIILVACNKSPKAGTPENPTRLDSVLVNIDGVDRKIPLDSPDMVSDMQALEGACVTPDLKRARLLRKGSECDNGWVSVKGNTAR